ncbi:putative GINS complex, subunit Psf1, GINS, helical bundle-like domain superfamily protein [Helianthus annuus]|nr:putative GINS complex, subunit Psf1, GINS, helical bundle-like domain superfamily protein [Helianthus annuus]
MFYYYFSDRYNRAETIQHLGRTIKRDLPDAIKEKLSSSENEYFENHAATLQSYMSDMQDLDLAVNMVPPKDPLVRVLEEIGNKVVLSDQVSNVV